MALQPREIIEVNDDDDDFQILSVRRVTPIRRIGLELLPVELQTIIYKYVTSEVISDLDPLPLIRALIPISNTCRITYFIATSVIFKLASADYNSVSLALKHSICISSLTLFNRYRPFLDTLELWSHDFTYTFIRSTLPFNISEVTVLDDEHCIYARTECITKVRKWVQQARPFNLEIALSLISLPTLHDDYDGLGIMTQEVDELRELFRNCFAVPDITPDEFSILLDAIVEKTGLTTEEVLAPLYKGGLRGNKLWRHDVEYDADGWGPITVRSLAGVKLMLRHKANVTPLVLNAIQNPDAQLAFEIVQLIVDTIGASKVATKGIIEEVLGQGKMEILRFMMRRGAGEKAISGAVVVAAAYGPPDVLDAVLDLATTLDEGAGFLYTEEFANRIWGEMIVSRGAGKPFGKPEEGYNKSLKAHILLLFGLSIPTHLEKVEDHWAPLGRGKADPVNPWLISELAIRGFPVSEPLVSVVLRTDDSEGGSNNFGLEALRVVKCWTGIPEARHIFAAAHHSTVHRHFSTDSALGILLESLVTKVTEERVVVVLMDVLKRFEMVGEAEKENGVVYTWEYVEHGIVGNIWCILRSTAATRRMGEEVWRRLEVWWGVTGWRLVESVNVRLEEEGRERVPGAIW